MANNFQNFQLQNQQNPNQNAQQSQISNMMMPSDRLVWEVYKVK